ncbi:SUKH-3 domain-containing protein [Tahibacter amnicola]|uniref:SUKH-3 domain-containing protein n=1 Tax=Tahibacter amnicola TaxID=2976241 RepID=A0ABY6B8T8_9GAMM|nr:SUKH-3 domain-containing protein [Tahibacter amnicola]UXI65977.1 SUKH-3 domain-containing protein [Tahibacter amnicola]
MTNPELSTTSKSYLKDMGWCEERIVDPTPFFSAMRDEGYPYFPTSSHFLSKFGGMVGKMPSYRDSTVKQSVHFNPTLAMEHIYREKVIAYEHRVSEELVVVGELYDGHMVLMLSRTGKLFGAYDDFLCLFGNSIEEGLNSLFEQRDVIEIP